MSEKCALSDVELCEQLPRSEKDPVERSTKVWGDSGETLLTSWLLGTEDCVGVVSRSDDKIGVNFSDDVFKTNGGKESQFEFLVAEWLELLEVTLVKLILRSKSTASSTKYQAFLS